MDVPAIVEQLDMRYLIDTLVDIAQVPTDVPLGPNVFMAPDDPKLVHYVQHILRPKLTALGAYDLLEIPDNQFVVRYGLGTSDTSPGHDLLYTSSDLSRLDFPDEISFFDVTQELKML